MGKILGLDLGTNSVGWAIVDRKENQFELLNKGVHIFSQGVKIEKGIESSKAAERTRFRSARRIKFRRKLRKQKTLEILIKHRMCPLLEDELKNWKKDKKAYPQNPEFIKWLRTDEDTGINPYYLRDKASREKISFYDLGRAFYHLAQRRGFLSNRLDQGDDGFVDRIRKELLGIIEVETEKDELFTALEMIQENYSDEEDKAVKKFVRSFEKLRKANESKSFEGIKEELNKFLNKVENLGAVKKGIAELSQKMQEKKCETLGQYFYILYQSKGKIRTHYAAREEHYLNEFNKISQTQQLTEIQHKEFYNAIFYQRPLKSQRGLIGKCSFEKNKLRCPVSHPAYEEYRALQFINSIKSNGEFLEKEQREEIWHLFVRKSKPNFDFLEIRNELTPKGKVWKFNYTDKTNVSGCPTIAQLSQKNLLGTNWKNELYNRYTKKEKFLNKKENIKALKTIDEVIHELWHVLFSFDKDGKLEEFGRNKLGLDNIQAKKFSKIILKKEYSSLSLKAILKILPYLKEGLIYSYAVFLANTEEVVGKKIWNNTEAQKLIRNEIKALIDTYNEMRRKENIVNQLITWFKVNYNNAHTNYELDKVDKESVNEKIISVYGKSHFNSLPLDNQIEIVSWIENKYREQLRRGRGEYIKPHRLDERIIDFFKDNFDPSDKALEKLYHPSDIEQFKAPKRAEDGKSYLGSPMIPSIKNPMAMRTMHRLRKLVNALIEEGQIDEETKIHVELARELNDTNKRKAIQDWQKDRKEERENAKLKIKELYKEQCGKDIEPTDNEILKYILWEEQGHKCLYTDNPINNIGICDFIGPDPKYDIEHTIPRSLSYDNSQENLTLCEVKFNRERKRNRIPSELANHTAIIARISHWKVKISEYEIKYNSRKKARGTETKEQKDKRIREKHYNKLYLDYWKGKYNRFERKDVPEGFKNSQLVDTGIITKYARSYLKSIFPKVYSVKGSMVKEFRELWGLQEAYSKKERVNHIHHCIDAVTIACMTKDKYDILAKLYHADEEGFQKEKKETLQIIKPWPTFTEDVKAIEHRVLVSHYTPENIRKQTKKKLRIRGKVEYKEDNTPIYQQGDTVRGSLHKDKFYGAIRVPTKDENGKIIKEKSGGIVFEKDKTGNEIFYVIRKTVDPSAGIDLLTESDIENIVDDEVKRKIKEAVKGKGFKKAMSEPIWMNEEKKIPIKKVRCFASQVKEPIPIKQHRDISKHEYKQTYNVVNDENYGMAIYEGKDKKGNIDRVCELINTLDAGNYYKASNEEHRELYPLVPEFNKETGYKFKALLTKGQFALLYKESPKEIWELTPEKRLERLYIITGLDKDGIKLFYHQEARGITDVIAYMNEVISKENLKNAEIGKDGKVKQSKLTSPKGGDVIDKHKEFPYIKFKPSGFNAILEGIDFEITITGEIKENTHAKTHPIL